LELSLDAKNKIIQEIWKPIKSFEDTYQISSHGRLKRFYFSTGWKFINGHVDKIWGYRVVTLTRGGIPVTARTHILVAMAFLGHIEDDGLEVHHIDFNKLNNFLDNLKLLTHDTHMRIHKEHRFNEWKLQIAKEKELI
jgi:hypothetical protein